MHDLIARKRLRYGARTYEAGDRFQARNAQDARLLVAVRRADPAPPPAAAAVASQAAIEAAAVHAGLLAAGPAAPKRRAYKRRDMTAEPAQAFDFSAAEAEGAARRLPADWPAGQPWPPAAEPAPPADA